MKLFKKKKQLWGKPFENAMKDIRTRQKELEEKDLRNEQKRTREIQKVSK